MRNKNYSSDDGAAADERRACRCTGDGRRARHEQQHEQEQRHSWRCHDYGAGNERQHEQCSRDRRAGDDRCASNANEKQNDAQELVDNAVKEVQTMKKDPQLKKLMAKAKGIYIVPDFGRGALIVGGRGGAGVVLAHHNGQWSDPAFYDFGAISFGAQAGASGGPIAFLLMSQNAVDAFKSGNKISLNAGAGLSIVTYSANAQASWGKGDIILWSNTKGAYAGATISVTDLNWADGNNKEFYGRKVDPRGAGRQGQQPERQEAEGRSAGLTAELTTGPAPRSRRRPGASL